MTPAFARSYNCLACSWYRTGSGSDRVKHSAFAMTRPSYEFMLGSFRCEHLFDPRSKWMDPVGTASGSVSRFMRSDATQHSAFAMTRTSYEFMFGSFRCERLFDPRSKWMDPVAYRSGFCIALYAQ
jgi:hypothetical protein